MSVVPGCLYIFFEFSIYTECAALIRLIAGSPGLFFILISLKFFCCMIGGAVTSFLYFYVNASMAKDFRIRCLGLFVSFGLLEGRNWQMIAVVQPQFFFLNWHGLNLFILWECWIRGSFFF